GRDWVGEAAIPRPLPRPRDPQYVDAEAARGHRVGSNAARHDPVAQRLEKNHVSLTAQGITLNPVVLRYAWPSELDLMARLAGLRLRERHGGWERRRFTADSRLHVSVGSRA